MAAQTTRQTQRRAARTGQPGLISAVGTRPLIHLPRQFERRHSSTFPAPATRFLAPPLLWIQFKLDGRRQLLPVTWRTILRPDAATRLEHGAYPRCELLDLDQKGEIGPA